MADKHSSLPLTASVAPAEQGEVVAQLQQCLATATPVYPLGGETSLDYGLPARVPGLGLSLAGLRQIVDYPARDMTVTVEAGVTMASLAELLARENQHLPIDVPQPDRATIGGVVACNWNGPRRYGYGGIRDHVIGIQAVDGRGVPFKGGGRVVKNVAGYDFCKLLTGSLGSLAVITQVTLRLRPRAEQRVWLGCAAPDLAALEEGLAALVESATTPIAITALSGPAWQEQPLLADLTAASQPPAAWLLVGLEGTEPEVEWMVGQLEREWRGRRVPRVSVWRGDDAERWLTLLSAWPQQSPAPLVLQAAVRPRGVTPLLAALREIDPRVSTLSHAGNGVVLARLAEFPAAGLSRTLVARLQTVARQQKGAVRIVSNPSGQEASLRANWCAEGTSLEVMQSVKRQFDPQNLLNPGRFVFP